MSSTTLLELAAARAPRARRAAARAASEREPHRLDELGVAAHQHARDAQHVGRGRAGAPRSPAPSPRDSALISHEPRDRDRHRLLDRDPRRAASSTACGPIVSITASTSARSSGDSGVVRAEQPLEPLLAPCRADRSRGASSVSVPGVLRRRARRVRRAAARTDRRARRGGDRSDSPRSSRRPSTMRHTRWPHGSSAPTRLDLAAPRARLLGRRAAASVSMRCRYSVCVFAGTPSGTRGTAARAGDARRAASRACRRSSRAAPASPGTAAAAASSRGRGSSRSRAARARPRASRRRDRGSGASPRCATRSGSITTTCVRASRSVRIRSMKRVGGEWMRYRDHEKEAHPEPPDSHVTDLLGEQRGVARDDVLVVRVRRRGLRVDPAVAAEVRDTARTGRAPCS